MTTIKNYQDKVSELIEKLKTENDYSIEEYLLQNIDLPYLAKNKQFVTAHKLKEFKRCEHCYYLKYIEEIPDPTLSESDNEALLIGSALDYRLTNGEQKYSDNYEVVSRRTGKSNKSELTNRQGELIDQMYREFKEQPVFDKDVNKKVFVVNFSGLILKAEIDNFNFTQKLIRDFKTTANIETFKPEYYTFQMAFYSWITEERTGDKFECILDVMDKYSYFSRSASWKFTLSTLQSELSNIIQLLDSYKNAHELGLFVPTRDQLELWRCPYYGYNGHGRKTDFIIY